MRWRSARSARVAILATVVMGALIAPPPHSLSHRRQTGEYSLIRVPAKPAAKHHAHGDSKPGDPLPDSPEYDFDADCAPVASGVPILAIAYINDGTDGYQPESDVLIAKIEDTDGSGNVTVNDTLVTDNHAKNFGVTASSPATEIGSFTVTSHVILRSLAPTREPSR